MSSRNRHAKRRRRILDQIALEASFVIAFNETLFLRGPGGIDQVHELINLGNLLLERRENSRIFRAVIVCPVHIENVTAKIQASEPRIGQTV